MNNAMRIILTFKIVSFSSGKERPKTEYRIIPNVFAGACAYGHARLYVQMYLIPNPHLTPTQPHPHGHQSPQKKITLQGV